MPEVKIFVDVKEDTANKIIISTNNAEKLGVSTGVKVEIYNPDNNLTETGIVEVSSMALDFAGQVSKDIIDKLQFTGIELIVRTIAPLPSQPTPISQSIPTVQGIQKPQIPPAPKHKLEAPKPHLPGISSKSPAVPSITPVTKPAPTPQQIPAFQPTSISQPSPTPQPMPSPHLTPPPKLSPPPSTTIPQPSPGYPTPGQIPAAPEIPLDPYPNKIDVNMLQSQRRGIILTPNVSSNIEGGRVQLSFNTLQRLGLGQGMLIAWEDPLTRSMGSARADAAQIGDMEIVMSRDTKEDTNIHAGQIVVYSTEPPIQKASEIMLEVQAQPNLNGYCQVSPRTQYTLSLQNNDVLAFEDELTGAIGAGKVQITEHVPDNVIIIDSEILEASGIGSFEVKISKNQRQIIPLQSVSLGVSPISGENMWEIISAARQSVDALKDWISNYIIFKGIKLRWSSVNIACSILSCVPDLSGDILAEVTQNTTVTLSPTGLVPFNAILIIDISRSMMARDVYTTNIAPAIEGIKAAMESREIQEFLKNFKEGIMIPRRIAAAFAAVLFLSEKVGRGFGEKVSVIRFADEAQILPFGESFYMDSASGKKGILEEAARLIVDRIGNSYGQATNMGPPMLQAQQILTEYQKISPNQPCMVVLLTDGEPTDGDAFFEAIKGFSTNLNVVIYILGLGNPNDDLMSRAAALCGGEYFKPEDAGELLIWYSKRARDLTVKLKAHKE
jgi:hypothetical protein